MSGGGRRQLQDSDGAAGSDPARPPRHTAGERHTHREMARETARETGRETRRDREIGGGAGRCEKGMAERGNVKSRQKGWGKEKCHRLGMFSTECFCLIFVELCCAVYIPNYSRRDQFLTLIPGKSANRA